jgi:ferredoxin-NADP reductase
MLNDINNLLNRVSMYRLLSITLTSLWAVALGLSLTGTISHSPLAIILSSAVLFVSVYFSGLLFATLFGRQIHGESSYITAFILFFIFTPTVEPNGLLALVLVAMVASASKFLLVFHGRHIFNPAAIAACLISLTGLSFATWWVATPPLMPVTLLCALAILYKTRQLQAGLTFLAIATPLVLLTVMNYGTSIQDSLPLLLSWPLLFFAGFMLSEPLTLPPKKWQQLVEAGIVAIIFALPIHIGAFSTSPAIALIIGNIVAFAFSQRRAISFTLQNSRKITPTSREFIFESNAPIRYEAGQYVEMTLPHSKKDGRGERRMFSITSAPNDSALTLAVKFYEPSSSFKAALQSLPSNSTIQATGIYGSFTLPANSAEPLLFIAGGIGITPFISHLRYLKALNEKRDITLVYAVADTSEIAYGDILRESGINVIIVTGLAVTTNTDWTYIHQPHITQDTLSDSVADISSRHAYISGPPAMVTATKRHLKQLSIKKVKTDYFTGY